MVIFRAASSLDICCGAYPATGANIVGCRKAGGVCVGCAMHVVSPRDATQQAGGRFSVEVPEVDGIAELDADLFAAFGIATAVDDLGGGAGAFVFATEDYGTAFFYGAAAEKGGAVTAGGDGPGFFVPSLVRVFAAEPDGDGAGGARAAADFLG